MCDEEDETREHFLLRCKILDPIRKSLTNSIDNFFLENNKSFYDLPEETQMQILLDFGVSTNIFEQTEINSGKLDRLETLSRKLIYSLHSARYRTLGINKQLKGRRA